jgi:hypothetical protein
VFFAFLVLFICEVKAPSILQKEVSSQLKFEETVLGAGISRRNLVSTRYSSDGGRVLDSL